MMRRPMAPPAGFTATLMLAALAVLGCRPEARPESRDRGKAPLQALHHDILAVGDSRGKLQAGEAPRRCPTGGQALDQRDRRLTPGQQQQEGGDRLQPERRNTILLDGKVVGAIGVSGDTALIDEDIAPDGAAALTN